jgi:hypothetical protein
VQFWQECDIILLFLFDIAIFIQLRLRSNKLHFEKSSEANPMRKVKNSQMKLGEISISEIQFDLRSRDEIPKLLMGLQHIYCTPEIREEVFDILEEMVPDKTNADTGRPGMELWKILVLGTLRLNCNWDYDKVQEMANNHITLRQMLGHSFLDKSHYALQTLKDNVRLLTPEILERINEVVVKAGHQIVLKKNEEPDLKGRCDSFVVETDVHYPTDINLLFDAITKVIVLVARACWEAGVSGWRQSGHNTRKIKKMFRKAQNIKHSTSKDKKKQAEKKQLIIDAHQAYIDFVSCFLERVKNTLDQLRDGQLVAEEKLLEIEKYMAHAQRQIDQIRSRVINGEKIPHDQKVFSIFEEHTEWICKGKAGVPHELGLRVCILEDQYGFILHHHVMEKQTDDKVTVMMVREAKQKFDALNQCSFDKGFYSPLNREKLEEILPKVILPKKGKLSEKDKQLEHSQDFIQAKRKHSAVESGINALENHSLDRCPDHGIEGFKRYVTLAVLGRNLQILGHKIQQRELKLQKRREKLRQTREKKRYDLAV